MNKETQRRVEELQNKIIGVEGLIKLCEDAEKIRFYKGGTWNQIEGDFYLPILRESLSYSLGEMQAEYSAL